MHLNERSLGPLMCVTLSESLVLDGRLREEGEEAAEAFPLQSAEFWSLWQTQCLSAVYSQNAMGVCYVSPELWLQGQTGRRVWPLLAWSAEEMAIGLGCIWDRSRNRPGY